MTATLAENKKNDGISPLASAGFKRQFFLDNNIVFDFFIFSSPPLFVAILKF